MMATNPSMRNNASGSGAWPIVLIAMYSQYVPRENVPALNQKPRTAARRGVAPCHNQMSTGGHEHGQRPEVERRERQRQQHARGECRAAADEAALDELAQTSLFL